MVPHRPSPRQRAFLSLDSVQEVLFGGAAGGGKTDAMLMAAAKYIGDPEYRGIIFRRTLKNAKESGSILDRALEWWTQLAHYSGDKNRFTYPSGATISFGTLEHENTKYNYNSTEFHFVGFDELTEFTQGQYDYLLSRLRRRAGCKIPLRARAATNPGGVGHAWVKEYFLSDEAVAGAASENYHHVYYKGERAFVPSKLTDNAHVDQEEYTRTLERRGRVTRARLLAGDWTAAEDGLVDPNWPRSWREHHHDYHLVDNLGNVVKHVRRDSCRRFSVVDCAASQQEITRAAKLGRASKSVITTFDFYPDEPGIWIVVDCQNGHWPFPQVRARTVGVFEEFKPNWIGIEDEKTGRALLQDLYNGYPVLPLSPSSTDKLSRASRLLFMLERGRVYFPESAPWLREMMDELLFWHGLVDEPADHIDTLAYAVRNIDQLGGSPASKSSAPFLAGGLP